MHALKITWFLFHIRFSVDRMYKCYIFELNFTQFLIWAYCVGSKYVFYFTNHINRPVVKVIWKWNRKKTFHLWCFEFTNPFCANKIIISILWRQLFAAYIVTCTFLFLLTLWTSTYPIAWTLVVKLIDMLQLLFKLQMSNHKLRACMFYQIKLQFILYGM